MKYTRLIIFSVGINFLVYFLLVFLEFQTDGTLDWYKMGGDSHDYICYGEGILHGEYRCGYEFVNRPPGLPVLYAFFRLFCNQDITLKLIVLLQVIVSSIAMFYLSLIAKNKLGIRFDIRILIIFFSTLFVYKSYDDVILTECLATSLIVIGLYFILKNQKDLFDYFISGACITWCIFLRPYTVLFIGLILMYLLYTNFIKNSIPFKKTAFYILVFLSTFIITDAAWIIRNYKITGKIIPFQDNRYAGLNESSAFKKSSYVTLWSWMLTIGEDAVFWNPGSMGSWMYGGDFKPDTFSYKPHMFSNSYSIVEIERVRQLYQMQIKAPTPQEQDSIEKLLITDVDKMIVSYKQDRFMQYHFMAPLRILKKSFLHSGSVLPVPSWPQIKKYPIHLVVKFYSTISYLFVLFWGIAGIFIFWKKNAETKLAGAMALSIIAVLALYLRYTEFRLYIIIFPLLAAFAILLFERVFYGLKFRFTKTKLAVT